MELKVIGWKIYYSKGTTFSSREGKWEDAPRTNVQFVAVYFDEFKGPGENLRLIHWGYNCYSRVETPKGIVYRALVDCLSEDVSPEVLKVGSLIGNEEFERIRQRVDADKDWDKA